MSQIKILCILVLTTGGSAANPAEPLPSPPSGAMWISPDRLSSLPVKGRAWAKLKRNADRDLGEPNLAGYTSNHDVNTFSAGLVYARTLESHYRDKATAGVMSVIGTERTGRPKESGFPQGALAVTVGRNLVSYILAADLIRLRDYAPDKDERFRRWIEGLREVKWADNSLLYNSEAYANNHGRMAAASRTAIAIYLQDEKDLSRTAELFKSLLGESATAHGFRFKKDISWQADPASPVGINPTGAKLRGFSVDGALPEEMRRGCPFQIPPCPTQYPWEALQGIVAEAVLLSNQGYDVWNWGDRAILRAVRFLERLDRLFPQDGWWATGDDTWVPWVINRVYGADFPTQPTRRGKNMGWTDWTHAPPATGLKRK